jgi:hypothetical protein
VISIDPVFYEDQPRIDRLFAKSDRGRFVRSIANHTVMFPTSLNLQRVELRRDWLRIPYTHVVCVAIKQ